MRTRLTWAVAVAAGCASPSEAPPFAARELAVRPTEGERAPLWRYDADDVVEHHDSARFRVHFTREGRHRVPAADEDADGVPDFVQQVAATYEEVLTFYTGLGFRAPLSDADLRGDNGGDGRFDVYLIDFARAADGNFGVDACDGQRCLGHVVQENDFAGYGYPNRLFGTRVLASHEFFHAIQAAYDHDQGVIPSEGSAVWASEAFDPTLREVEAFAAGYLDDPGRSLDVSPGGPVPRFAYGAGLFFQFLAERYDRDLIRTLWERLEDGRGAGANPADPQWLDELATLLSGEYASSFAEALTDFARWNLFTGRRADAEGAYARGERYPDVAMEAVEAPFSDERLRVFHASTQYFAAVPAGRAQMTAALVADDPEKLNGLALFLTTERDGRWTPVERADPAAGTTAVDTDGATRFVAYVVNTAIEGESRRPGLCLGSPDEVVACRRILTGAVDAGAPDAAPEPDAAPDAAPLHDAAPAPDAAAEADAAPPDEDGGGGGCVIAGDVAPLWLALPALALRRRRRCTQG